MLGEYTITFHQEVKKVPYSEANKMLYFTGWGLTAEGMLKPDVICQVEMFTLLSQMVRTTWMQVRVWRHHMRQGRQP